MSYRACDGRRDRERQQQRCRRPPRHGVVAPFTGGEALARSGTRAVSVVCCAPPGTATGSSGASTGPGPPRLHRPGGRARSSAVQRPLGRGGTSTRLSSARRRLPACAGLPLGASAGHARAPPHPHPPAPRTALELRRRPLSSHGDTSSPASYFASQFFCPHHRQERLAATTHHRLESPFEQTILPRLCYEIVLWDHV